MNAQRHVATLHRLPRRPAQYTWRVRAESWSGQRIETTVRAHSQAEAERLAADGAGVPLNEIHRSSVIRMDDAAARPSLVTTTPLPPTTGLQDLADVLARQRDAMDTALARHDANRAELHDLLLQHQHQTTTADAPLHAMVPERLRPAWMTPHYTRLGALLLLCSAVSAVEFVRWLASL